MSCPPIFIYQTWKSHFKINLVQQTDQCSFHKSKLTSKRYIAQIHITFHKYFKLYHQEKLHNLFLSIRQKIKRWIFYLMCHHQLMIQCYQNQWQHQRLQVQKQAVLEVRTVRVIRLSVAERQLNRSWLGGISNWCLNIITLHAPMAIDLERHFKKHQFENPS